MGTADQPPDVLAIIGKNGENLTGPLVNACCTGLPFGIDEKVKEEGLENERRSHDKAAREGFPYNTIVYHRYVQIN
jgi:hypothetical protein